MTSLVFDYVARQKIGGTNLTFGYLHQLPWPTPSTIGEEDLDFIVPRVLELTYTSHSMKPFADDLGHKGNGPFAWNEDRRHPYTWGNLKAHNRGNFTDQLTTRLAPNDPRRRGGAGQCGIRRI